MTHYFAIGDCHGMYDQLGDLLDKIKGYATTIPDSERKVLIYLGDLVDRGPESKAVIDRARAGEPEFDETIVLRGNHEEMMINCFGNGNLRDRNLWYHNGGHQTMMSYGDYTDEVLKQDVEWLKTLPYFYQSECGQFFFVHAGIRPGIPIDQQDPNDLVWIRFDFLMDDSDHGPLIVHGHTPQIDPEIMENRVNLDTGAFFYGKLTCGVFSSAAGKELIDTLWVIREPASSIPDL